jgi:FMN-dependent NADH-azoreductase
MAAFEYAQSYLLAILSFIGIDRPELVVAEGLELGAGPRAAALDRALASVDALDTMHRPTGSTDST